MSDWIDLGALGQVVVLGLVVGAGLPILFAQGVRAQTAAPDGRVASAGPALAALCYAIVIAAVVLGVLFVARDFIGHHTGWYVLGAEAP